MRDYSQIRIRGPVQCFNVAPVDYTNDPGPGVLFRGWSDGGVIGTAADPLLGNTGPWGFGVFQDPHDGTYSIQPVGSFGPSSGPSVIPGTVPGYTSPEFSGPDPRNPLVSPLQVGGGGSGVSVSAGPGDVPASSVTAATSSSFSWVWLVVALLVLWVIFK